MDPLLTRLFQVQPGERRRVFAFMLLGGLLQCGLAIGISAADSLFLVRVGAEKLPVIYVATPLLMMLYIPAYTHLLGRHGVGRVFDFTLGFLVVGCVLLHLLLSQAPTASAYYAAKFWSALWYVGLYTMFWNFVDGYFDLSTAKRLFGLLSAGPAAGAIVGGAIVQQFAGTLGVAALFLVWAALAAVTWPLLRWIRHHYEPLRASTDLDVKPSVSLGSTLRRITSSRYISVLVLVLFLTLVTATICEYQYLHIFSESTDETTLAALFGELFAAVNIFNLCVSLFVFHLLVGRLGVRNTALIQPLTFLVVFALLLVHGGFGAALLGFLAYQGIMTSIDFNNVNLLFNGLPEEGKSQVRTFIEGLCEPLSTALAGVFLFFVAPRLSPEDLSGIGFAFACVLLCAVLLLRSDYSRSMITNVRRSWLDFSGSLTRPVAEVQARDVELLESHIRKPVAGEQVLALRLLWQHQPRRALDHLLTLIPKAAARDRRELQPMLSGILANNEPDLQRRVMEWSETVIDRADPQLLVELGRRRLVPVEAGAARLETPDADGRAAAAAVLWRSSRLEHGREALDTVSKLLHGRDDERRAGLRGLGHLGESRYLPQLIEHLDSGDPDVRLEVLDALAHLVDRSTTRLVPPLLARLGAGGEPGERERIFALLGRIADSTSISPLLLLAGRFTPHERRLAEQVVIGFGPRAVARLVNVVQNLEFPVFARSIALRALARLAFPHLQAIAPALVDALVQRSYRLAALTARLAEAESMGPGLATLLFVHRNLPQLTVESTLEVLSVTGRIPGFDSIIAALRSGELRDRAYALENIEQGSGRHLFTRLQPFLTGRSPGEIAMKGREFGLVPDVTLDDAIARSLQVRFPLEFAAALQALHERRREDADTHALEKLRQNPPALVRETALVLLARNSDQATALTPVERVWHLAQAEFFHAWGVRQLELVGERVRECRFTAGQSLVTADGEDHVAHLVLRGSLRVGTGRNATVAGTGSIVGQRALLGDAPACEIVRAETDSQTLRIAAKDVLACARIHPQVAVDLLRRREAFA